MSEVERLKVELHQVGSSAKQAAGGLAAFKDKFAQHAAQVQALISGTATGADRDIIQILDAAGHAVDSAVQALETAGQGCTSYADQI